MSPKKISLELFIRLYSKLDRSELNVAETAIDKLDPHSEAYRLAENLVKARDELFDYLETAGFKL